jgi:hypothetical protein
LQALAEKAKLIKDFAVSCEDTTNNNVDGIVDLAIIPMLKSNLWVGGLTFLCPDSESAVQVTDMESFCTALGQNMSLRSLGFAGFLSLSKAALGNLWEALKQNETLESLRFVSWSGKGSSVNFPDNWERDFVLSVLPSLSVTELELTDMKLSEDETLKLWKTLASNERLERLSISDMGNDVEWERSFVTVLPSLSLRQLYLPNFQQKVDNGNYT